MTSAGVEAPGFDRAQVGTVGLAIGEGGDAAFEHGGEQIGDPRVDRHCGDARAVGSLGFIGHPSETPERSVAPGAVEVGIAHLDDLERQAERGDLVG